MSVLSEVTRDEIAVQFVRVPDGIEHIRRAWDELEAVIALRGRHFYGAFDPGADDYRACVEVREGTSWCPASSRARSRAAAISGPACRR
jgi:Ethanolamine utilization protein EutJ (predicted chaperonin)